MAKSRILKGKTMYYENNQEKRKKIKEQKQRKERREQKRNWG